MDIRMKLAWRIICLMGLASVISAPESQAFAVPHHETKFIVYVGTYGKGVFGYRFDAGNGDLEPLGLLGTVTNPSFLATDPENRYLYAASEVEGDVNGDVAAFAIDRTTAALKLLNTRSSDGQAPCHVSVDHTGKMVFAANYTTGEVAVFPIKSDGSLGELSQLMKAHGSSSIQNGRRDRTLMKQFPLPTNRFLYVPDLGLDEIRIYKINAAAGTLSVNDPPVAKVHPGNGPRHIALSANGKFAYVVNELKPVVTVFARDRATGALDEIQEVSAAPGGFTGENAQAEIALDGAGRFLYASNRGPGTIAVFAVTPGSGMLKQIQIAKTGGTVPRGFEIDPSGSWLLAGDQKANRFVLFERDPESGKLTLTGKAFDVPSPVSFVFVPPAQ